MTDPTQVPPFASTCTVSDGVVTAMTGWANAQWAADNGAVLIPEGTPVEPGWLFDGATFTAPPTVDNALPEGTPDDDATA